MPELDGTDTARELREVVGQEVPILIISAYEWSGIEIEAGAAGINRFIQKPLLQINPLSQYSKILLPL